MLFNGTLLTLIIFRIPIFFNGYLLQLKLYLILFLFGYYKISERFLSNLEKLSIKNYCEFFK